MQTKGRRWTESSRPECARPGTQNNSWQGKWTCCVCALKCWQSCVRGCRCWLALVLTGCMVCHSLTYNGLWQVGCTCPCTQAANQVGQHNLLSIANNPEIHATSKMTNGISTCAMICVCINVVWTDHPCDWFHRPVDARQISDSPDEMYLMYALITCRLWWMVSSFVGEGTQLKFGISARHICTYIYPCTCACVCVCVCACMCTQECFRFLTARGRWWKVVAHLSTALCSLCSTSGSSTQEPAEAESQFEVWSL